MRALTEVKDELRVDCLTVITDDEESHGEINIYALCGNGYYRLRLALLSLFGERV